MRKKRDLTGQKFGKLTARYILPKSEWLRERTTWFCTCECGGTTKVVAGDFAKGSKTNCGCMSTTVKKDLTGKRFGMLTAIHEVPNEERTQKNKVMWECLCDCGNTTTAVSSSLVNGIRTSCGCDTITYNDLTGQKFNMLTVVGKTANRSHSRQIMWLCECACGRTTQVRSDSLTRGEKYSCGCTSNSSLSDIAGKKVGKLTVLKELPKEERIRDKGLRTWLCTCDCGSMTKATGHDLRNGKVMSCGCDNDSLGEAAIRCYLDSHTYSYRAEFKFDGLHHKSPSRLLRFDFAVLDQTDQPKLLIEFDGQQHFAPFDYYGGEEGFKDLIARDTLKNNYCLENNIPLIRIPYTSYNDIEEILDKALKDYIL